MRLPLGLSLTGVPSDPYGPELVTNGTFDTVTTGWTGQNATLSVVSAQMRVTNTITGSGYGYQAITTEIGATYRFQSSAGAGTRTRVGTTIAGTQLYSSTASGAHDTTVVATATTTYISLGVFSGTAGATGDHDTVSFKKVL